MHRPCFSLFEACHALVGLCFDPGCQFLVDVCLLEGVAGCLRRHFGNADINVRRMHS